MKVSQALPIVMLLLAGACVIAVVDRSGEGRPWPIRGETHRTLDLDPGGAVILDNSNGDIEISGWNEAKVDITAFRSRVLPSSGGVYFLGKRFSPPEVRSKKTGETITIKSEVEGRDGESTVYYALRVPRSIRLERISNGRGDILVSDVYGRAVVSAGEGRVEVENYSGSLDIRLGRGRVAVELLDLRPEDHVRIKVDEGDVLLTLEPGTAAKFMLEAPAGDISSEIDLGQPLPARKVSAATGEEGATLEVTALQGNI